MRKVFFPKRESPAHISRVGGSVADVGRIPSQAELNRHMKIHLGQKDHVCLHAGCGKLFVQVRAGFAASRSCFFADLKILSAF